MGHSTSLKRGQERKSQELQAKKQKREQDWRAIQKLKATEASGLKHLKASQNACMQLDMKKVFLIFIMWICSLLIVYSDKSVIKYYKSIMQVLML